jgi:hypothetical protein
MAWFCGSVSGLKDVESSATATAGLEPRHAPTEDLALEQRGEGFTTTDLLFFGVAAAFDVEMGTHQRVPPQG